MNNQLNSCNKCWEDLTYFEETVEGIEYFVTKCSCGEFSRERIIHKYTSDWTFERWQKANPISHAGRMLEYRSIKATWVNEKGDGTADSKLECLECLETIIGYPGKVELLHKPTCPLITEAKLPLKVKEGK